jgi:hypothetical protein
MKALLRALFVVAVVGHAASAAEKPDFTGNWTMNAAKSSFGGLPPPSSMSRSISHVEPLLNIVEEQVSDLGTQSTTRKYTTDGKEMSFESQGAHVTSSATWNGSDLIVVSNVAEAGLQFTDQMTLSDDGRTLTSAVRITSTQGTVDLKVVFDRK